MSLPSKLWEVRSTASAGLGVFAKLPIPRGTRIFSEKPLLSLQPDQCASNIYPSSFLLPSEDRKWLLGLSTVYRTESTIIRFTKVVWWSLRHVTGHLGDVVRGRERLFWGGWRRWSLLENLAVLNVFRNNSFDLRGKNIGQALFKGISRINHSCVPNSQGNFHAGMGTFNVHATRDIGVGEEVTVSYLPEACSTRDKRVTDLNLRYGFECGCPACDLRKEVGMVGEERRKAMQRIFKVVLQDSDLEGKEYLDKVTALEWGDGRRMSSMTLLNTPPRMVEKFIWTLEKGGVAGREVSSLYMELSRLYLEDGKPKEALKNAEKGLLLDEACLGVDHPTYKESLKAVQALIDSQSSKLNGGGVLKPSAKTKAKSRMKV